MQKQNEKSKSMKNLMVLFLVVAGVMFAGCKDKDVAPPTQPGQKVSPPAAPPAPHANPSDTSAFPRK
jgi:uncharacterized lipoprotein YajG